MAITYDLIQAAEKFQCEANEVDTFVSANFEIYWLDTMTGELLRKADDPIEAEWEFRDEDFDDFSQDLDCGAFSSDPI